MMSSSHSAHLLSGLVFSLAVVTMSLRAVPTEPRLTIQQLTSIFENSNPDLQYAYCENIGDRRGYTFGFAGFTSGTYDGTLFLIEYSRLSPGNALESYLVAFQAIDAGPHDREGRNSSLTGLEGFPEAFRASGGLPGFEEAQHLLADRLYWAPSQRIARRVRLRLPLSEGQFYDACLNHGERGLADLVRKTSRSAGGTPRSGLAERRWVREFLSIRLQTMRRDPVWKAATDRVRVYQRLLATGNVRLQKPFSLTCYGDSFTLR